ncbi:MAG TPA: XrtA system polysaccharide chain length determinant [Rhizomicrobium sp.]|nr:XrtA system polysaccharide chain length determinant [Rhizomicrobium sp.]
MQPWLIQVRTYLTGAWHYRWIAIGVAWAICVVGWIGIAFVPNQFQAVAKIYVDTDTMMAPLLKGLTVSTDPEQQVSVMLNTLLTRPNLEQVVHLTNPNADQLSSADMAREVQRLLDNITITPLPTKNLFEFSVADTDPNRSLSISQSLLSIFVDSNIGDKRRDLEGAQSFLDQKIAEYEVLLKQSEQRRAEFREANLDVLANATSPEQAAAQLQAAQAALGAAEARLSSLRSQLAAIPKVIYVDGPGPIVLGTSTGNVVSTGSGGSLLQRLAEAKQALLELQSRYTDDHPDVKAAKREIAELQAELAATPAAGSSGSGNQSVPNPVYVQTQSKLSDAMTDVAFQAHQVTVAKDAVDRSNKMTAQAIAISTKFASLDRDYDLLHKTYQDLLARRESARLSQSVNDQQSAITVRVIEPPKKAPFPVAPNRPLLNSIVLLLGLAGGIGAAVALSMNAGRFSSKEQLSAEFDYPIIGVVGRISQLGDALRARRAILAVTSSMLLLFGCYMVVLLALDSTFRGTLQAML